MANSDNKRLKLTSGITYAVVLVVLLAYLVGSAVAPRYQVIYYDNQLRYIPSLTMIRDGVEQEIELPETLYDLKKDERIVLTGNYQTKNHDSLLVKIEGAKLVLYVNDNEAYSIKGDVSTYPEFQKLPSPDIMFVALPNESGSKTLRFEYTVPEARSSLELPVVYIGENSILFEHLSSQNVLPFVLSGILFLGGALIIAFTFLIIQRIKKISSLVWIGAASILAGLVGLGGNDLAIYLMTMPNLLYSASIIGVMLFPIPFLQYAYSMLDPVHKKPLRVVQVIIYIAIVVLLALHLTGLVTYAQDFMVVQAILLVSVLVFLSYTLIEFFAYGSESARFHVAPACILLLLAIANAVDRFTYNITQGELLFQLGVLAFLIWTSVYGWNNIRRMLDEAEHSMQLSLEVNTMNRSLDMQRSLYQRLSRSTDEVRRVRHDLRHQLSAIRGYLQKGNVDAAIGYVDAISGSIPDISNELLCDNFAVNAVATHYLNRANDSHIKTDIKLAVPESLGQISDNDMNIIVGNLFENAIEACMYVEQDKRFIRINCRAIKNRLTLTIDNSFDGNYIEQDGSLYSRKRESKGIGVSSVQAVVERYDGAMRIEASRGVFMISLYVKM